MAIALSAAITEVRSVIDEPVAQFYLDSEITTWLNEGCSVAQREVEWAQRGPVQIATTAAVQNYLAPSDLLRIHRVEFVPNNNTSYTYSLDYRGLNESDQAWGNLKTLPSAYPDMFTLWNQPDNTGTTGAGLTIILYPVPSVAGHLNLYYLRNITAAAATTDYLDILPAWENVPINYSAYRALRKDADPRWRDFRDEFQMDIEKMKTVSRSYSDQGNYFSTGAQNVNPLWIDLDG
jgi:hypothetical protein